MHVKWSLVTQPTPDQPSRSFVEPEKMLSLPYGEWHGDEPLNISDETAIKITMGGVIYVVHSLKRTPPGDYYRGIAASFIGTRPTPVFQSEQEAQIERLKFNDLITRKYIHLLRLDVGDLSQTIGPHGQRIEVYPPVPEE